jgi:glycine cleavage system H protein
MVDPASPWYGNGKPFWSGHPKIVGGKFEWAADKMVDDGYFESDAITYCPVAGKVAAVNEELTNKPERINEDCYNAGWICKLQVTNKAALDDLMDAEKYEAYLQSL